MKQALANSEPWQIAIVGAGVSGLSAAHWLSEYYPKVSYRVFEADSLPGGWIRSLQHEGCIVEQGPESLIREPTQLWDLCHRLGLQRSIVFPKKENRGAYVLRHGKLVRVPEGFRMLAPSRFWSLLRSPTLSWKGKIRALCEPLLPRIDAEREYSVAEFIKERFGAELFENLAEPLVAGVYGGQPERLSMPAVVPQFMSQARIHGSMIKAMLAREKQQTQQASGARYDLFFSFDRGLQVLTDTLAEFIGDKLLLDTAIARLHRQEGYWILTDSRGQQFTAKAVLVALPAPISAALLRDVHQDLSDEIAGIEYGSAAVVTACWKRTSVRRALDAYGFVVPRQEHRFIFAGTWSSEKYPLRAPSDQVLCRFYLGEESIDKAAQRQETIIAETLKDVGAIMGIRDTPMWSRVDWMNNSMPRYYLGHLGRVSRIFNHVSQMENFELTGNAYEGVGIAAAVRSAQQSARRLVDKSVY